MNDTTPAGSGKSWYPVAELCGLTRATDLPLLLWPLLWAAWLASGGAPDPSRLTALVIGVLLARSAAWAAYAPEADNLRQVPRERRLLIGLFAVGALCFALPLGWAGLLVPLALGLVAVWFNLRERSYLSDPLLAMALSLFGVAAWLSQGAVAVAVKTGGLLWLASLLWLLSALMVVPTGRKGATLALLAGDRVTLAVLMLKLVALAALGMVGRQAPLGIFLWLGLTAALGLALYQYATAQRSMPPSPAVLEGWWGAAVFGGVAFQFLCACQLAAKV